MKNFRIIPFKDPDYPELLRHIHKPPEALYLWGNLPTKRSISIVGTRKSTLYGASQTRNIVRFLRDYPFQIISGFADGIDLVAHHEALEQGLPTVAVLGHGFDHIPPRKFSTARKVIEQGGGFLSEYPPSMPGNKFQFPERNRIIAGLSKVTIVVEAPKSSGALITATLALENNREVFAIPGDTNRENSQGCNELIQQAKATILLDPANLLHAYGLAPETAQPELFFNLPQEQQDILKVLSPENPKSSNQILAETNKNITEILVNLTILESEKRIKRVPGGFVIF
ncbi:MAG: DNA-processing protein DprA [Patescibacteria group bacterium]